MNYQELNLLSRKNVEFFVGDDNELFVDLFVAFVKKYEVMVCVYKDDEGEGENEDITDDGYCGDSNDIFIYHDMQGVTHENWYQDVPKEKMKILLSFFREQGYTLSKIIEENCINKYTISFEKNN